MLRNISASRPITTCRRPEGAAWKNRRVIRAAVPLFACAALTIVACSDSAAQRTEENYCRQVNEHLTDLSAPVINTEADVSLDERDLLLGVFDFGETTAEEVMVPRVDIVGIEQSTP